MPKNIIYCADGTWNDPYQDVNGDLVADNTNVFKLFLRLAGTLDAGTVRDADEQEKELCGDNGLEQIAKYIHGVGDSRNPIVKIMGGSFGAGVISRIVRGYTFISRNYTAGDAIYIIGFSRGAYTARALAGMIASVGLLSRQYADNKENAYLLGAAAWSRYRNKSIKNPFSLGRLAELFRSLPAIVSCGALHDSDLVPVGRIAAVGVWDTVGAMGIPTYKDGQAVDAFEFADRQLSTKVGHGFQALALDEQRVTFTPTLWDSAENVTQALFPGAHADVGGGYPTTNNESGLSDCALAWMMGHLVNVGVLFASVTKTTIPRVPDPAGTAHKPWIHSPWTVPLFPKGPRSFPDGTPEDPSIAARMAASPVVAEPWESPAPYLPANRPKPLLS